MNKFITSANKMVIITKTKHHQFKKITSYGKDGHS